MKLFAIIAALCLLLPSSPARSQRLLPAMQVGIVCDSPELLYRLIGMMNAEPVDFTSPKHSSASYKNALKRSMKAINADRKKHLCDVQIVAYYPGEPTLLKSMMLRRQAVEIYRVTVVGIRTDLLSTSFTPDTVRYIIVIPRSIVI